jgi:hypothetical protein
MRAVRCQSGIILPVVLILIGLLALTMTGFIFFVRAEAEGIVAFCDGQQGRLAAESGLEEVIALLREERHNVVAWYDVPSRFRNALVWGQGYDRSSDPVRQMGSRREMFEQVATPTPAWRFSVVAPRLDGPEDTMRYGLMPESAKLNLNQAEEWQIEQLLTPLLADLGIDNPREIINAILDWRDPDDELREEGAENAYYNALDPGPPYNAKNGNFDTVEELLLVKGVTAAVLYGEDVNRNGILDDNEDDGEKSFPYYDNGDGILDQGIAPFLTVWSREVDVCLDNKPRISLHNDGATVTALMVAYAEAAVAENAEEESELDAISPETQAFIASIAGNQNVVGQMRSPADLYVGEVDPNEVTDLPAELLSSPVTLAEMSYIMNRFTTRSPESANQPIDDMLININAAPLRVLQIIPNMTAEAAAAIADARQQLIAQGNVEALRTTAWPLTTETIDAATFGAIAPHITTKAYQFHVEVLGYADHVKTVRRLEWVIEMIGPVGQIRYHRDLTRLGLAWPLDDETVIVVSE